MKISVITPVFNRAETIVRCLDSVAKQTWPDTEHILMDAGSTDGTIDLITSYRSPRPIIFDSRPDQGIYDGMNRGLERAAGEWIVFLGGDDYLADDLVVEKIAKKIDPSADLVLTYASYENGKRVKSRFGECLRLRNFVHHQGCMYKRHLFEKRKFEVNYRVYGDYDFNLYLLKDMHPRSQFIPINLSICARLGASDSPAFKNYLEQVSIRHSYYSWIQSLPCDLISFTSFLVKVVNRSFKKGFGEVSCPCRGDLNQVV